VHHKQFKFAYDALQSSNYKNQIPLPLIKRNTTAITAITNKTWMIPEALYAKTPIAQPINNITAIIYNILLIVLYLFSYT
jgi:hypothetical protein